MIKFRNTEYKPVWPTYGELVQKISFWKIFLHKAPSIAKLALILCCLRTEAPTHEVEGSDGSSKASKLGVGVSQLATMKIRFVGVTRENRNGSNGRTE